MDVVIAVEDAAAAWLAFAEMLSARTPTTTPPLPSRGWVWPAVVVAVTPQGAKMSFGGNTDGNTYALLFPPPMDSKQGFRDIARKPAWRRCPVWAGGKCDFYSQTQGQMDLQTWREALLTGLWPSQEWISTAPVAPNFGDVRGSVAVLSWMWAGWPKSTGSFTFPSILPVSVDIAGYGVLVAVDFSTGNAVYSNVTPADPNQLQDLASVYGWENGQKFDQELVDGLYALADAFAQSEKTGALTTQRGDTIVSIASSTRPVAKRGGTADDAAKALAAGIRASFGGGLSVRTRKPDATVMPWAGYVRMR